MNPISNIDTELRTLEGQIAEAQTKRDAASQQLLAQNNTSDTLKKLGDADVALERFKAERAALLNARGEIRDKLSSPVRRGQREHARKTAPQLVAKCEKRALARARRLDELFAQIRNELAAAFQEGEAMRDEATALARTAVLSDADRHRLLPVMAHYAGALSYMVEPLASFLAHDVPRELANKVYSLSSGWNFGAHSLPSFEAAAQRACKDLRAHVETGIEGALAAEENALATFGEFQGVK